MISKHDTTKDMSFVKREDVGADLNFSNKPVGIDILDDEQIRMLLEVQVAKPPKLRRAVNFVVNIPLDPNLPRHRPNL